MLMDSGLTTLGIEYYERNAHSDIPRVALSAQQFSVQESSDVKVHQINALGGILGYIGNPHIWSGIRLLR